MASHGKRNKAVILKGYTDECMDPDEHIKQCIGVKNPIDIVTMSVTILNTNVTTFIVL